MHATTLQTRAVLFKRALRRMCFEPTKFLLLCSYKIAIEFIISFTDVSSRDGDVETTAKLSLDDSQVSRCSRHMFTLLWC